MGCLGLIFWIVWEATEMLHIFLSNCEGAVTYGTSGIVVPGYELRCVTEEGSEIVPDDVGELLVKGWFIR